MVATLIFTVKGDRGDVLRWHIPLYIRLPLLDRRGPPTVKGNLT